VQFRLTNLGGPALNAVVSGLFFDAPAVPAAAGGVAGGGFEAPAVAPGNFTYAPAGSAWTFTGSAGLAANGSAFTSGNPPAPEGGQVAILQGTGGISQTLTLAAGTYAVTVQAAQRGNWGGPQTFQVLVDGTAVGTVTTAGAAYAGYATASVTVAAGSHTLTFQGLNPGGGDNTALLDQVQLLAVPAAAARVSYAAADYDAAGRPTAATDVGTNGGLPFPRPATAPARSDTALVTSTVYDDAGRVSRVTDPRGLEARTSYDALGRTTQTVENYVDGVVSNADDKTTRYTYAGPGLLGTVTALLTGGGSETTQYVYGVTPADGSARASNDLLRETRYPDKTTGAASATDHELTSYDALGERTSFTDRNGSVHTYSFDVAGRPTADAVTTLATGVDGSVRRLETAYDSAGRAYLFTSYDAASAGNVVNQVQRAFNGLGQIVTEYQATTGAVNTSTTPKVQYTYSEMAGGANHSRVTSLINPDGFTVSDQYNSGLDDRISRLSSLANGGTTLEAYSYLGLGTVVVRSHPQDGVDLTYVGTGTGDGGDQYVGLDRFGRVVDQRWKTGAGTDLDRFQYGYDRDANRLYRTNELNHSFDELYHANGPANGYDGLNQLAAFARGTLSDTNGDGVPDTVASPSRSQSWSVDALGNFTSVTSDGTAQGRTHNKQNQLTGVGGSTLTYDASGNLTTDETGRTFAYDAWNRLVGVSGSARYAYDALSRRVKEGARALYYTPDWQVVEERQSGAVVARNVWSQVYVDALVLRDRDADGNPANGLEERLYALADANYNITALVNTAGSVVERYAYDSYGQPTVLTPTWGSRASSSYAWVYLHQGGRYDGTAGLYDFRRRNESPTLMRWDSPDPIGLRAKDPDLYRYEGNSPLISLDPDGLQVIIEGGAAVAGGGTAAGIGAGAACLLAAPVVIAGGSIAVATNTCGCADRLGALIAGVDLGYIARPIFRQLPKVELPPIEAPRRRKPKKADPCKERWEKDTARCDGIAAEMKRFGYEPVFIARWLSACKARAEGRFGRCNNKEPDTLEPYPVPPGIVE
jgi:RHS repeat-associated protein